LLVKNAHQWKWSAKRQNTAVALARKKLKLKTGVEMGLAQGEVGDEELSPFL
jgi:hypothetical protein